jgi:hypothetical protein
MRSRAILAAALATAGLGFSMCAGLAAQSAVRQSSANAPHRSSHVGERPCSARNSKTAVRARVSRSCQGRATSEVGLARQPDLPAFPAASDRPARSSGAGDPSRRLPLQATETRAANLKRNVDYTSGERQRGNSGKSVGLKFTGGMGVPLDRLTVEGASSPYQQPNGNTGAATSSNLVNGIGQQGMHFGFELQY